jgi:hypothetical protein
MGAAMAAYADAGCLMAGGAPWTSAVAQAFNGYSGVEQSPTDSNATQRTRPEWDTGWLGMLQRPLCPFCPFLPPPTLFSIRR